MPTPMTDQSFPVNVLVTRPDGTTESVRVGTAIRSGDGFRLTLGELSIGANPDAPSAAARRPAASSSGAEGMVFPPYGRSKGAPIHGASMKDLEFYRNGCLRTLDDPAKSRWHDKERTLLAAIDAEIARQTGGAEGGDDFQDPGPEHGLPEYSDEDIPF
jgi:hypothetical protein